MIEIGKSYKLDIRKNCRLAYLTGKFCEVKHKLSEHEGLPNAYLVKVSDMHVLPKGESYLLNVFDFELCP